MSEDPGRHDEIDQALRRHTERWRASLPPVPDLATARIRRTRARRRQVAAAAAAVLLVAGGISLATGVLTGGAHRSLPPTTPTHSANASTPAADVPWKALPAKNPTLPVTTVPASPDPAAAAGVRACTADDLQLTRSRADGAAGGTMYLPVRLVLTGTDPCRLQGYPIVRPLGHGTVLALTVADETDGPPPTGKAVATVVRSGEPAIFRIAWARSHSCPVMDNDRLEITLPGIARSFTIAGFGTSFCNPGEPGPAVMTVEPVQPLDYARAYKTSPYAGVTATGDLDLTATTGRTVAFTITLTSDQDLPLVPCPDYDIETSAGPRAYGLNCDAVPYRDAEHRPYLPAGVPVRFAMQADPGPESWPKFEWQLIERDPVRATVIGTLTVHPAPQ